MDALFLNKVLTVPPHRTEQTDTSSIKRADVDSILPVRDFVGLCDIKIAMIFI